MTPSATREPLDGDSYELVLAQSGHTLRMKPEASILDTVLALGVEAENDCRDGICGSCVTPCCPAPWITRISS